MQELAIPGAATSASLHGRGTTLVVLGHGAGGNRNHPMLRALAEAVAASGRAACLYNFAYAEKGARRPDPRCVLEATTRAAAAFALETTGARRIVQANELKTSLFRCRFEIVPKHGIQFRVTKFHGHESLV